MINDTEDDNAKMPNKILIWALIISRGYKY